MRCSKAERELAPYLDGLLKEADERAIEAHVGECRSCREALNDMRAARDALHILTAVRAPASFAPRVKAMAQAHLERTWCPTLTGREVGTTVLAAAAALVLVASWYVTRPRVYVAPLTASVATLQPEFGEVIALARVSEPSDSEGATSASHLRRARPRRPEVRLASLMVPVGAGRAAAPPEPEDVVAPAEADVDEAEPPPEAPTPAATRPTTRLAALDARLLGISPGPLTSTSAALPAAMADTRRESRAETDVPEAEVARGGTETETPRVAHAAYHVVEADAPVSFAVLLSTQPLPSPADMSY